MNPDEQKMANDLRNEGFAEGEEKKQLSDKEVVEAYINDPKTKINAIHWAAEFQTKFNGNWFTVEKVQKKYLQFREKHRAITILKVCCMVGVAHCEERDGVLKYKICVTPEQKIQLLEHDKSTMQISKERDILQLTKEYDIRIASIEKEIERLSGTLPKQELPKGEGEE